MKENVQIKLLAYPKGTSSKVIKKLVKQVQSAWKATMPGVPLCVIPVEMDPNTIREADKAQPY